MGSSIKIRLATTLIFAMFCASAQAEAVFVLGPLEGIAPDGSKVTVLGQTFSIAQPASTRSEQSLRRNPGVRLSLGSYVYIEGGRAAGGGLVANSISLAKSGYVPGSSEVFLSGIVAKYEPAVGILTIGAVDIYATEAFVDSHSGIAVGDMVQIEGKQAQPSGVIWASSLHVVSPESIQGTGIQSIQGTGIQSIQGTGIQSIQGTGIQSIQGTGIQSIQGTGIQSIQGTGIQSIQGTGIQSIQGTGLNDL
jgi:hypothetical protein